MTFTTRATLIMIIGCIAAALAIVAGAYTDAGLGGLVARGLGMLG